MTYKEKLNYVDVFIQELQKGTAYDTLIQRLEEKLYQSEITEVIVSLNKELNHRYGPRVKSLILENNVSQIDSELNFLGTRSITYIKDAQLNEIKYEIRNTIKDLLKQGKSADEIRAQIGPEKINDKDFNSLVEEIQSSLLIAEVEKYKMLGLPGRLNRSGYAIILILSISGIIAVARLFLHRVAEYKDFFNHGKSTIGVILIALIVADFLFQTARRLRDVDLSGWLVFLIFIPRLGIINLILGVIFLLVKRGTVGSNKYGPESFW